MFELKDEILDTSGQPDSNVRYKMRNNNGDVLHDDIQLELKTPTMQEGTALNKSNIEKAIMTRIGRDYVVQGGLIRAIVRAAEDIGMGELIEYKTVIDNESDTFYANTLSDYTTSGSYSGTPFAWYKDGLYLVKTSRTEITLADFKSAINAKADLFTYNVKSNYTVEAPQSLSNYSTNVVYIKKVVGNVFAIFYTYERSSSYTYYSYLEIISIDEEYNITKISTTLLNLNVSRTNDLLVIGENGNFLALRAPGSSNYSGDMKYSAIHIEPNGTFVASSGTFFSGNTSTIYYAQYDKIDEDTMMYKFISRYDGEDNKIYRAYIKHSITTNTVQSNGESVTVNTLPALYGYSIINGEKYGIMNYPNLNSSYYIYFRFNANSENLSDYVTKICNIPSDNSLVGFIVNGKSFIVTYSSGTIDNIYIVISGGTLGGSSWFKQYVGTSMYSSNPYWYSCSHEVTLGGNGYYLLGEAKAFKNSGAETSANLQRISGISSTQATKGNRITIYEMQNRTPEEYAVANGVIYE